MSYTIAQAAKRTGLGVHTLRYYDKEGLLPFVDRTAAGIRDFKESDFDWLSIISCLKKTGMPVKQIKHYIDLCMMGDSSLADRLGMILEQKKAVEQKMAELEDCMSTLKRKVWYYETAVEAGTEDIHKNLKAETPL